MPFAHRFWMVYKALDFPRKSAAMRSNRTFFIAGRPGAMRWASFGAIALALILTGDLAKAQSPPNQGAVKGTVEAAPQAVPGFWDPRRRPDRPDLSRLSVIRFLTETDYPPFNFTGPDGNPAGFNV